MLYEKLILGSENSRIRLREQRISIGKGLFPNKLEFAPRRRDFSPTRGVKIHWAYIMQLQDA
jgi:hypothetical protein